MKKYKECTKDDCLAEYHVEHFHIKGKIYYLFSKNNTLFLEVYDSKKCANYSKEVVHIDTRSIYTADEGVELLIDDVDDYI